MKKILIIEDEEIMIDLLQKKLTVEGYEISVARDGKEGLEKMKEVKPDLILLDIIMPKMGGFEVMEEMQKDRELKKIPVIVVSNSGQPVEIDKAQALGAKDWLIKTEFDPQEVIDKVKKQIGN
ncbi:MAG: response regulator [Candidatus Nealsonbacteria bacterium CG10_big_fil_rev_8_21_14_0_10_36_23]|uniref:Response regulator n=1 Tax=Candidatus Nealsonbacteria bacterium CG10_big_fil_rev_8_21_14_0_10_36_23 TaxID=1974709 RepID=A0A2H0TLX3_9BACT|nr:MAG: response regulator [Candidatus Nealsonbacteria bacterium CG10_big_fil_rev_8_21_14_0_10_36_23]